MAEGGSQGLGDLFALFGGNPIASISKNIDNFRKGVEGFLTAVQNFNRTMETLDSIANRVTRLMDDVEEPVRVLLPQVTKATKQSLALFEKLSEPLDRVIPGLEQLAGTLNSPSVTGLPTSLGEFLETLGDVAARLRPLSQIAEAAGNMAGNMFGMRGLGSMRLPGMPAASTPAVAAASSARKSPSRSAATPTPAVHKAPAKKAAAKKGPAKQKAVAKKTPANKAAAKKSGSKKK